MDHQKVLPLLNKASDSKIVTRKWNSINDQSKENYDLGNKINLCDYNDADILKRSDIITTLYNDLT